MRDVFFLSAGLFQAPRGLVSPGPLWTLATQELSLTVAVCERDDGSLVLVDAGFGEAVCAKPASMLGWLRRLSLGARLQPSDAISLQLAALGYARERVRTVIATHCHLDHVSGVVDFPDAELVTTAEELRAYSAISRDYAYRAVDLASAERIRVARLREGPRFGFPASLDLFGDGEIILLDAEGHTPGHLAVGIRGPRNFWVHVGDAVFQDWEYGLGFSGPCRLAALVGADRKAMRLTHGSIRACTEDESRPIIVPSHDLNVFDSLPQRPTPLEAVA